ncbi:MAG: hypothetical protein ACJASU_000276 [Cognaticolwellia sp.]|jgi:hypothetical protein
MGMFFGDLKNDIIALDGKVMRGTLDKANGSPAIHLVSVWSVKNNMCFGQIKVSDKSNEITAIPKLLKLIHVEGGGLLLLLMLWGLSIKLVNK